MAAAVSTFSLALRPDFREARDNYLAASQPVMKIQAEINNILIEIGYKISEGPKNSVLVWDEVNKIIIRHMDPRFESNFRKSLNSFDSNTLEKVRVTIAKYFKAIDDEGLNHAFVVGESMRLASYAMIYRNIVAHTKISIAENELLFSKICKLLTVTQVKDGLIEQCAKAKCRLYDKQIKVLVAGVSEHSNPESEELVRKVKEMIEKGSAITIGELNVKINAFANAALPDTLEEYLRFLGVKGDSLAVLSDNLLLNSQYQALYRLKGSGPAMCYFIYYLDRVVGEEESIKNDADLKILLEPLIALPQEVNNMRKTLRRAYFTELDTDAENGGIGKHWADLIRNSEDHKPSNIDALLTYLAKNPDAFKDFEDIENFVAITDAMNGINMNRLLDSQLVNGSEENQQPTAHALAARGFFKTAVQALTQIIEGKKTVGIE